MKSAHQYFWYVLLAFSLLGLAGCSATVNATFIPAAQSTETIRPSATSTPFSTSTTTPIPTLPQPSETLPSTPELLNTLTTTEQGKVITSLLSSNGGCTLPCVWGITAGDSSVSQGIEFLTMLGFSVDRSVTGVYNFGYDWGEKAYFPIRIEMQQLENSDLVKRFHIAFGGDEYLTHIQYFSIQNLLSVLGMPSEGWINLNVSRDVFEPDYAGSEIVLYYEDESLVARYSVGAKKEDDHYRICPSLGFKGYPEMGASSGGVVIWTSIDTLATPNDIVGPRVQLSVQKKISEAFGISLEGFIVKTVEDPDACFNVEKDQW